MKLNTIYGNITKRGVLESAFNPSLLSSINVNGITFILKLEMKKKVSKEKTNKEDIDVGIQIANPSKVF